MGDVLTLGTMIRLVLSFAAVVGGLIALRWWTQRGSNRGTTGINVVARSGVARGASVAVIEVAGLYYLVGITEHGVSLLGELDEDAARRLSAPRESAMDQSGAAGRPESRGPLAFDSIEFEDLTGTGAASGWRTRPWTGLITGLRRMTARSPGGLSVHDLH